MSTPFESYRGKCPVRTPDAARTVVIVTRQSDHRAGPVWLTLYGAWRGTVCLAHPDVDALITERDAAHAIKLYKNVFERVRRASHTCGAGVTSVMPWHLPRRVRHRPQPSARASPDRSRRSATRVT